MCVLQNSRESEAGSERFLECSPHGAAFAYLSCHASTPARQRAPAETNPDEVGQAPGPCVMPPLQLVEIATASETVVWRHFQRFPDAWAHA